LLVLTESLFEIFKYFVLIVGLNLLPNDDLEKKFKRLNKEEILLKNNKAGASATGRKFSLSRKY
jgi:hypothetical protein